MKRSAKVLVFIHKNPRETGQKEISHPGVISNDIQCLFNNALKIDEAFRVKLLLIEFQYFQIRIGKSAVVFLARDAAPKLRDRLLQIVGMKIRSYLVCG